jgi:hypothetical protein
MIKFFDHTDREQKLNNVFCRFASTFSFFSLENRYCNLVDNNQSISLGKTSAPSPCSQLFNL